MERILWREARELITKGRSLRWSLSDTGHLGKWCNGNPGKEGFKEGLANSINFLKVQIVW